MYLMATAGAQLRQALSSTEAYRAIDRHRSIQGSTPLSGACYPVASAIRKWLGKGEIIAIVDQQGSPQHWVVNVGEYYFDADGVHSKEALVRRWRTREGIQGAALRQVQHDRSTFPCPTGAVTDLDRVLRSQLGSGDTFLQQFGLKINPNPKLHSAPFLIDGSLVRLVRWEWKKDKDYEQDVGRLQDVLQVTWSNDSDIERGWVADIELEDDSWYVGDDRNIAYPTDDAAAFAAVIEWIAYRDKLSESDIEKLFHMYMASLTPGICMLDSR